MKTINTNVTPSTSTVTTPVLTADQKAYALKKSAKLAKAEKAAIRAAATAERKQRQLLQEILPGYITAPAKIVFAADIKAVEDRLNRRAFAAKKVSTLFVEKYIAATNARVEQIAHRSQASDRYGDNFANMFEIANSNLGGLKEGDREIAAMNWSIYNDDHTIAGHSGSMNRKTEGFYFSNTVGKQEKSDFFDWCLCGLNRNKLNKAANKLLTYVGLVFSSATPMIEKYGCTLDITRACVLQDPIINIGGKHDIVSDRKDTDVDADYVERRIMTDGRITTRCKSIPTCSIRFLSVLKGCVVYDATEFHGTAVDIWGNEVNLEEKDIIIYVSAFKLGQPPKDAATREYDGSWFKSFDDFVAKATERGAQFYVCRDFSGEPKRAWACYQDLQTAFVGHLDKKMFDEIVGHTKAYFEEVRKPENAWRLLERSVGNCVRSDFGMYNIPHVRLWLQAGWDALRNKALGAGVPDVGWYMPISVDTRGVLHGNEIYCDMLADGQHVSLARKPLIGPDGQFVAKNVANYPDGPRHTVIIAADSMFWQAANADMDGDAVLVIDLLPLVRAVYLSQKKTGCKPVVFPESDSKAELITDDAIKNYCLNRTTNTGMQIGNAVNDVTARLAHGMYDRAMFAVRTYEANDGVNAGKHASTSTVATKKSDKIKLPMFRTHTRNKAKLENCEMTNGVGDLYMLAINDVIPERFALSEPVTAIYDPSNLFDGGKVEMVSRYGNVATQNWLPRFFAPRDAEEEGLFQVLAFYTSDQYKKLRADEETLGAWAADSTNAARLEMFNLAQEITEENPCFLVRFVDVFEAITCRLFFGGMKDVAADRHTELNDKQLERKLEKIAQWNKVFGTNLTSNGMKVNGLKEQMIRFWFMIFEPEIVAANKAAQRKRDEETLLTFDIDEALAEINNDAEVFCLGEQEIDPEVAYTISDDIE